MIEILMNLIFHLDQYLYILIDTFGIWTYVILFMIIFIETGFVVFPFLPGDSLLFITGALAAANSLNVVWLFILFCIAAILGDTVNYWMGRHIGRKVFRDESKFFKKEYLLESEKFYKKHGAKAIVIARFIPIIRTFAPFVAGIAKMHYKRFVTYNILGGIAWVALFLLPGYYFGNIPIIKDNISIFIIGIIIISLIPPVRSVFKHMAKNRKHH